VNKSKARKCPGFFTKARAWLGLDDFRLAPPLHDSLESMLIVGKGQSVIIHLSEKRPHFKSAAAKKCTKPFEAVPLVI